MYEVQSHKMWIIFARVAVMLAAVGSTGNEEGWSAAIGQLIVPFRRTAKCCQPDDYRSGRALLGAIVQPLAIGDKLRSSLFWCKQATRVGMTHNFAQSTNFTLNEVDKEMTIDKCNII